MVVIDDLPYLLSYCLTYAVKASAAVVCGPRVFCMSAWRVWNSWRKLGVVDGVLGLSLVRPPWIA